jgi:hypothetical protein
MVSLGDYRNQSALIRFTITAAYFNSTTAPKLIAIRPVSPSNSVAKLPARLVSPPSCATTSSSSRRDHPFALGHPPRPHFFPHNLSSIIHLAISIPPYIFFSSQTSVMPSMDV